MTSAEAASYAGASTGRMTASGAFRAAPDQRQAGQLRTAQHLDRRDELVEVDMQHPRANRYIPPTSLPREAGDGAGVPQARQPNHLARMTAIRRMFPCRTRCPTPSR